MTLRNPLRFVLPAFAAVAVSVAPVAAVQDPEPPCPTVTVSCPDDAPANDTTTYTAAISGGDPEVTPTYNWTVSAGSIESGQGTSTIVVTTAGLAPNTTITASADVGGYSRACSTFASCTVTIVAPATPAIIAPATPANAEVVWEGKAFRAGDRVRALKRAGTVKPHENPGGKELVLDAGKTGALVAGVRREPALTPNEPVQVVRVRWDAQSWIDWNSGASVKVGEFESTVHVSYLAVIAPAGAK